jgi:hypothetical protein
VVNDDGDAGRDLTGGPFHASKYAVTSDTLEMTSLDDAALWSAFWSATLPAPAWTHRSHVRVAFLHLDQWTLDEAHLRMRVGIIRLNASHGLEETPSRGYHETITRAWLALVAHARAADTYADSNALLAAHPDLLDRGLALRFYSRSRLMSLRARATFVEPDLAPLPALPAGAHEVP